MKTIIFDLDETLIHCDDKLDDGHHKIKITLPSGAEMEVQSIYPGVHLHPTVRYRLPRKVVQRVRADRVHGLAQGLCQQGRRPVGSRPQILFPPAFPKPLLPVETGRLHKGPARHQPKTKRPHSRRQRSLLLRPAARQRRPDHSLLQLQGGHRAADPHRVSPVAQGRARRTASHPVHLQI